MQTAPAHLVLLLLDHVHPLEERDETLVGHDALVKYTHCGLHRRLAPQALIQAGWLAKDDILGRPDYGHHLIHKALGVGWGEEECTCFVRVLPDKP